MAIAQEAAIWSAEEQETSILLIGIETVAATMYKHKHNITRYVHLKTELPFGTAILPYGCIWSQHATGMLTHLCLLKYSWSIRSRTSLEIHRQVNIYTMVFLSMKKKTKSWLVGKWMQLETVTPFPLYTMRKRDKKKHQWAPELQNLLLFPPQKPSHWPISVPRQGLREPCFFWQTQVGALPGFINT